MKNKISALLEQYGVSELNPMQIDAHQCILKEQNTLLLSPTGSGKTLAYLLPLLEMMRPDVNAVQCLILVPSRELAQQIEHVWKKLSTGFKVNVCYGGNSSRTEVQNFTVPPALLIGTPGRIADHINKKSFALEQIFAIVYDEYDKALEFGFHEQMSFIASHINSHPKQIFVSATSSIQIPEFSNASKIETLNYIEENSTPPQLETSLVVSDEKDKINTLFQLICSLDSKPALIFCNHRDAVDRIQNELAQRGVECIPYHGGMDQENRELALIQFRGQSARYLITTDLAARGLDIPEMEYVIHYHLPQKAQEFTHRNGRTARMHASGQAYILLNTEDKRPNYLDENIPTFTPPASGKTPIKAEFQTLFISGGRKDKVNKMDIVGFLSHIGQLQKDEIGLIEVKDHQSFVAIKKKVLNTLLKRIVDQKIKGKKYKIGLAEFKKKKD